MLGLDTSWLSRRNPRSHTHSAALLHCKRLCSISHIVARQSKTLTKILHHVRHHLTDMLCTLPLCWAGNTFNNLHIVMDYTQKCCTHWSHTLIYIVCLTWWPVDTILNISLIALALLQAQLFKVGKCLKPRQDANQFWPHQSSSAKHRYVFSSWVFYQQQYNTWTGLEVGGDLSYSYK